MSVYDIKQHVYRNVNMLSDLEDKYSVLTDAGNYEISCNIPGISKESVLILCTYNDLYRKNFKNRITISGAITQSDEIDYSPLINELAKFFELEINLSIVQWMRQNEGIEMPKYYNKYREGNKEYIWQDNINFNQRNQDGSLKGIPIGSAYHYAQTVYNCSNLPEVIHNAKELLKVWDKIRMIRNTASHGRVSMSRDFELMIGYINKFILDEHLDNLMRLKHLLMNKN